jgi:hypothetical protein
LGTDERAVRSRVKGRDWKRKEVVMMSTAAKVPMSYPVRPRRLRVAEPALEGPRSALALVVLVAMLAVTVVAGWEEFRVGQRDDTISTLQGVSSTATAMRSEPISNPQDKRRMPPPPRWFDSPGHHSRTDATSGS